MGLAVIVLQCIFLLRVFCVWFRGDGGGAVLVTGIESVFLEHIHKNTERLPVVRAVERDVLEVFSVSGGVALTPAIWRVYYPCLFYVAALFAQRCET